MANSLETDDKTAIIMNDSDDDVTSLSSVNSEEITSLDTSVSSIFSVKALFGGQLTGRQYSDIRLNPVFLEYHGKDDRRLKDAEKTSTLRGKPRPSSAFELTSSEQQDSGVSSDISSADSQASRSPLVQKVEQTDKGEVVMTFSTRPSSSHNSSQKPELKSSNSFKIEKSFPTETTMIVAGNCVNFNKNFSSDMKKEENSLATLPVSYNIQALLAGDKSSTVDAEFEDHYQTIDAVIVQDPETPDKKNLDHTDCKSDDSDDIAQLYAQVRKGPVDNSDKNDKFSSTIVIDPVDDRISVASSSSQEEFETGTMVLNPRFKHQKPASDHDSSHVGSNSKVLQPVLRTYSDSVVDSVELSEKWNAKKIGKRRKKDRSSSYKSKSNNVVRSSPAKQLKSILISSSQPRLNNLEETTTLPKKSHLSSHSTLSEQKSVKFSEDTVDNENKTQQYRKEIIQFCDLHRHQNGAIFHANELTFLDDVPFAGTYPWPAQPRDNFVNHAYVNGSFSNEGDIIIDATTHICPTCCQVREQIANKANPRKKPAECIVYPKSLSGMSTDLQTIRTANYNNLCNHEAGFRVSCQACLRQHHKSRLQRRRKIMRWSLLIFLILVIAGLATGLIVHFVTRSTKSI